MNCLPEKNKRTPYVLNGKLPFCFTSSYLQHKVAIHCNYGRQIMKYPSYLLKHVNQDADAGNLDPICNKSL